MTVTDSFAFSTDTISLAQMNVNRETGTVGSHLRAQQLSYPPLTRNVGDFRFTYGRAVAAEGWLGLEVFATE